MNNSLKSLNNNNIGLVMRSNEKGKKVKYFDKEANLEHTNYDLNKHSLLKRDACNTQSLRKKLLNKREIKSSKNDRQNSGDSKKLSADLGKLENNCNLPRKKVKQAASPMNSSKKIPLSSLHDARDQERISKRSYYLKEYAFANNSGNLISSPL